MECIICQDIGSEPLQDNINCNCKYKFHSSCWIDYIHSRDKVICPLCRKDLTTKKTPLIQPISITTIPYTPQIHTIPQELGQQILYQDIINTNQQYNSTYRPINVSPSIHSVSMPPRRSIKREKIIKIVVIGIIIIIVIVLIALFA
jgi:hypothetical protein